MNLTAERRPIRQRRIILISAIIALLAIGVATYWHLTAPPKDKLSTHTPVPVSTAVASRQNVPVYQSGLGAVQASLTVGIRPQVDGTMQDVVFVEGQNVRKGDVLARIDPRLFKAALDQALAKKAQDTALLVSARKDLERYKALVLLEAIARQTADHQQATVDQLEASIAADEAAISTARTQLFVAFAITATAIEMARQDDPPVVRPARAIEAPRDPLREGQRRCQQLGQAAASDAECMRVWAETRDRFLGRTSPPTPAPDLDGR